MAAESAPMDLAPPPNADDAFADRDIASALLGQRIGNYRIERELGRGGMGVVYLAVHAQINQQAAIKVLAATLAADPAHRARFLREAQASSRVRHDGLVRVFDYGEIAGGPPYIMMEYLAGDQLRKQMLPRGRRMQLAEALRIIQQIATALDAAHASGIVHRDLKPENVMLLSELAPQGGMRCKVLDFGIARFVEAPDLALRATAELTDVPTVASQLLSAGLGTPGYMSPEHFTGQTPIDSRSDVYALGVMLYEMLCGQLPFTSEGERLAMEQVFQIAPRPRDLAHGLPGPIDELIGEMLAKAPEMRPSMAEVAARIDSVLATPVAPAATPKTTAAISGSHQGRLGTRIAIRRGMALLLLAVLVLVGLLEVISYWLPLSPPAGMVRIKAGRFTMGSQPQQIDAALAMARRTDCSGCTRELFEREQPARQVKVPAFYLDKTEVTNSQYSNWLNRIISHIVVEKVDNVARYVWYDKTLLLDLFAEKGYSGIIYLESNNEPRRYFSVPPSRRNIPIVYVTWDGARSYCEGNGKRLPTEAEWEFAARGPEGREFPWGNTLPQCGQVAFGRGKEGAICTHTSPGPVDVGWMAQDVTPEGIRDLGGNVAEWVMDAFEPRYPPCDSICVAPQVLTSSADGRATLRVLRGGAWFRGTEACRSAGRSRWRNDGGLGDTGFRCAQSVK
jgi:serine/threonine protein kinase